MFDIENNWEEIAQEVKKSAFFLWQFWISENFEEVAEVISSVKREPLKWKTQ